MKTMEKTKDTENMKLIFNKLPKELLIEILIKQNSIDYWNEKECLKNFGTLKKRIQELRKIKRGQILKELENLIPKVITANIDDRIKTCTYFKVEILEKTIRLYYIYNGQLTWVNFHYEEDKNNFNIMSLLSPFPEELSEFSEHINRSEFIENIMFLFDFE
jgi:hypothetical protein